MKETTNELKRIMELLEMLKLMTDDEQKMAFVLIQGYSAGLRIKNSA